MRLIVFTDLDGTLLDHETYSYDAALPALSVLKKHKIPIILSSSKTAAEIFSLQNDIGIEFPAITENGGGVWIPENYFYIDMQSTLPGKTYDFIEAVLNDLPTALRESFEGFCDWSAEVVAEKTGLTLSGATLAKKREWSVPGLWSGDEEGFQQFCDLLEHKGLQVTKGGRFIHIMGNTSKGKMLNWLVKQYADQYPECDIVSVALGDAPNDKTMLEQADYSFVIPNVSGNKVVLDPEKIKGRVTTAKLMGPAGWNISILELLNELNIENQGDNL